MIMETNTSNISPCYWFIFCRSEILLLKNADGTKTIPLSTEPPVELKAWEAKHHIATLNSYHVYTVDIDTPRLESDTMVMMPLRASYYDLSPEMYNIAGKCAEILYWDKNTRFCGVCGAPMKKHTDISKRCTACGKEVWPQLATAIIVLVRKGENEVLLIHPHNIKGKYHGLVAGFVETGETLEECVVREVMEETGISIKNIKYFGSQPWPYPCGLMIGFFADYDGGDIILQRSEVATGGWFNRDNMPAIPEKMSIARMLIDAWLEHKDY